MCGGVVVAQDTLPDKNGDLSGFRLDTPPPKEKAVEPAPKVEAPMVPPVAKAVAPPAKTLEIEAIKAGYCKALAVWLGDNISIYFAPLI